MVILDMVSFLCLVRVEVLLLKGVNGCIIEVYEGWVIVLGLGFVVIGCEVVFYMFCEVMVFVGLIRIFVEIKFLYLWYGYVIIGYGLYFGYNVELLDVFV